MALVKVATLDSMHAEVVREALGDAEIAAQIKPVKRLSQLPLVPREMVDIEVEESQADAARAVLEQLRLESEEAVRAEARGDEGATKSEDDLRVEEEERNRPRARFEWTDLWTGHAGLIGASIVVLMIVAAVIYIVILGHLY